MLRFRGDVTVESKRTQLFSGNVHGEVGGKLAVVVLPVVAGGGVGGAGSALQGPVDDHRRCPKGYQKRQINVVGQQIRSRAGFASTLKL